MKRTALLLALVLLLAGCGRAAQSPSGAAPAAASHSEAASSAPAKMPESAPAPAQSAPEPKPCYFDALADAAIARMALEADADSYDKILAAYRYVIQHTFYAEYDQEELCEAWRYLDPCGQAPSIYETMAAGPLQFGIGTCEHFSAALMVLLQRMGFETLYATGLTWSYDDRLVDHAWAMVNVDGQWYHIDPQLEDNVMRERRITYRYFLKSDAEFAAHHIWGAALDNADAYALALPECPASAPTPQAHAMAQDPAPDPTRLLELAKALTAGTGAPSLLEPKGTLPPLPRNMP